MATIEIPEVLKRLLKGSTYDSPIQALVDRAGVILSDNKLPFFPDYTDHGTDHINGVLKAEVELIPKDLLRQSSSPNHSLSAADSAMIIAATVLHDIAMHLREDGFLELVGTPPRFSPLDWFKESHDGHDADRPWKGLWEDYVQEARRFSSRQLTNILGEKSAAKFKFDGLPESVSKWDSDHRRIIGEFIRRHHARLAHEIAIFGLPGVEPGDGLSQFPAMGERDHALEKLADLIGLVARSHGMSLRVCKAYLRASPRYGKAPRPMGSAILYPMALLRVADYLQLDQQRAPAVLLQLRNPQSPVSLSEWKKHRAVEDVGPADDPRALFVTVTTDIPVSLYLQLKDLLSGLQIEMDHSTAVLDESYGNMTQQGLNHFCLNIRRVDSNLYEPGFREQLPYIPEATSFTADPNVLSLLIEPLYGKQPSVGIRELIQNSVDAVRELKTWCSVQKKSVESLALPVQDHDVLIEYHKREDGRWYVRVQDRGIGMQFDTIRKYFLRAGASFRQSAEWSKVFVDDEGNPRVTRSGRFGVGVFALFLLGPSFRMWTRHAGSETAGGLHISASLNSEPIVVRRARSLSVGTAIEVELSKNTVDALGLSRFDASNTPLTLSTLDWYTGVWPTVSQTIVADQKTWLLRQQHVEPIGESSHANEWFEITPKVFDRVLWSFHEGAFHEPRLSCNGIRVARPSLNALHDFRPSWNRGFELLHPSIAVVDSSANLPLTVHRYELTDRYIPCVDAVARDVTLSFIAHALVCGPESDTEALGLHHFHPQSPDLRFHFGREVHSEGQGFLRWCTTGTHMVPADPYLYSLLGAETCLLYGSWSQRSGFGRFRLPRLTIGEGLNAVAAIPWYGKNATAPTTFKFRDEGPNSFFGPILSATWALGNLSEYRVDVSIAPDFLEVLQIDDERSLKDRMWHKLPDDSVESDGQAKRTRLFAAQGFENQHELLRDWMVMAEQYNSLRGDSSRSNARARTRSGNFESVVYAAQLRMIPTDSPASPFANVWVECLGPKAIPFDRVERDRAIALGCKHPELKRHIESWQRMKFEGSSYTQMTPPNAGPSD